jgi:hypothetical protein
VTEDFPGAIGVDSNYKARGIFVEAVRNLTALTQHIHGNEAFERLLEEDADAFPIEEPEK